MKHLRPRLPRFLFPRIPQNLKRAPIFAAICYASFGIAFSIAFMGCEAQQSRAMLMSPIMDNVESVDYAYKQNIGVALNAKPQAAAIIAPIPATIKQDTNSFAQKDENPFKLVSTAPLSTFSSDVDTASYAIVRKKIESGELPSADMVRIEELLNSFSYNYEAPQGDEPIAINLELAPALWNERHQIARIGLRAREIDWSKRKSFNLVFLIDTSGSMQGEDRLGLVQKSLKLLVENLSDKDSVGIVTYAGDSRIALKPTNNKKKILEAIDSLSAFGSTNGSGGIERAYDLAQQHFIKGGYNRVILATDGDFNVGITSESELLKLIKQKAQGGIYLSVFGYGMGNYKDAMLQKLADSGNGNYGYIDTLLEAKKHLVEQVGATLIAVAKDVKIQVEFNPAKVAAYRLIGYEKRVLNNEDFNDDKKDAGEMGSGHRVTALYEIVPAESSPEALSSLNGSKLAPGAKGLIDPLKYSQNTAKNPANVQNLQDPNGDERVDAGENARSNARGDEMGDEKSDEWLNVKIRYKEPANKASSDESSKLIEKPLDSRAILSTPSADMRFAQSVAGFGLLLMDSAFVDPSFKNSTNKGAKGGYQKVLDTLSQQGVCDDSYKQEFLGIVAKASRL